MNEEINIPALMDSIAGIDRALLEENILLKKEFLKANIDFINQQLVKLEYQNALTEEQKNALEAAINRVQSVIS